MTDKQKTTLVLFAQNYSVQTIAKKQRVSASTIRERIKSISKNYQSEFDNAIALRNVYKRNRDAIRNMLPLTGFNEDTDMLQKVF